MQTDETVMPVSLRLNHNGSQMQINVPSTTKISQIKAAIYKDVEMLTQHCEIIFCGQVMKDDSSLQSYAIDSSTTLHVVNTPSHNEAKKNTRAACKVPLLTGIWMHRLLDTTLQTMKKSTYHDSMQGKAWPVYYAFCKQCDRVVPSKLRVCCDSCKQETICIRRGPEEWIDVIRPKQILGYCQSNECTGDLCDAEFYFKCVNCASDSATVPLPNVISNCNEKLCSTCLDSDNPLVTFPCSDDHLMCLPCFEQYARTNLRERSMIIHQELGYTLQCPEGCDNSCLTDTHILHILGSDEYQVYQSYAAEECLLLKMTGLICPNPQCAAGLFPMYGSQTREKIKAICPSCKFEFCPCCKEDYHGFSDCIAAMCAKSGHSKGVRDYFESIRTIGQISKKCPGCQAPTERNGGCMHMTCRSCHYDWCWHCGTEWNSRCQADHWFG